jgi:hypothetical protein
VSSRIAQGVTNASAARMSAVLYCAILIFPGIHPYPWA